MDWAWGNRCERHQDNDEKKRGFHKGTNLAALFGRIVAMQVVRFSLPLTIWGDSSNKMRLVLRLYLPLRAKPMR